MYKLNMILLSLLLLLLPCPATLAQAKPPGIENFEATKRVLRQQVYHDQNTKGDFYCGCSWQWVGRSGGRMNLKGCAYKVRAQKNRAERLEWEHIMPASNFGRARQCWQKGGRSNCRATDPVFSKMEGDPHNLVPSVGEINGDRSNYRFGMLPKVAYQHGKCDFKVNFSQRVAEPSDSAKGAVARIYFYMHDRYSLPMSSSQKRLFTAWDRQFPVTEWELERDLRITKEFGFSNPFIQRRVKATYPDTTSKLSSVMQSLLNVTDQWIEKVNNKMR